MKHIFFIIILFFTHFSLLFCQAKPSPDTDSIGFEQQRERINKLLAERSKRFGDLDNSLQKKTGVFGIFKTKKDMQKSIDILKQIVLTDNHIFLETKKLLDIKDNESNQHETLAHEYDEQVTAYMRTISKLRKENEKLRDMLNRQQKGISWSYYVLTSFILLLLGMIIGYKVKRKKFDDRVIRAKE